MKRQYTVKTRFSFTGTFFISARNKGEAKEYVEKHCGLVLGRGIHSSLPDDDVDWVFPIHPDLQINQILENKEHEQPAITHKEEFITQGGLNEN